jgi:predicted porin
MKRISNIAAAVLAGCAGLASAQSSVTLYGTVDLSGKYVKNDGSAKRLSLARDGINNSQIGLTGSEDLGSGLRAGFNLQTSVGADAGDIGDGQANGKFWSRRAYLYLINPLGELRMGRDYTPTFWANTLYDAFGNVGVGASSNVLQLPTSTFARADNSISYLTPPTLGGFFGQATVAAAEGGTTANPFGNAGRYVGARVGYAKGPMDISIAAGQQRNSYFGSTQKTYNIGGYYDFGVAKVLGYLLRDTAKNLRETRGSISVVVPLGQSEVHAGYDRSKLTNTVVPAAGFTNVVWHPKVTYQYNLSKRSALYASAAEEGNGDHSALAVARGTSITAPPKLGGKSKGFELGVRHFF